MASRTTHRNRVACTLAAALLVAVGPATAWADQSPSESTAGALEQFGAWLTPERISGTVGAVVMMSALSLAPALLLMTTCFVRLSIVLSLLRQAIGAVGVPSPQVLAALAMFMTAAIMWPVWTEMHDQAMAPYQAKNISGREALDRAAIPLSRFMARQIERTGNSEDVWLFLERSGGDVAAVTSYDQVPLHVLAPAFLLSELKTAFLIGFQIYLPFLVIDLVVSSVMAAMGLSALSPNVVSLPAKLMLFVLVDGWRLIVGMLLGSFA
jgi:flagellar biosynthetic protein FliP